jgi:hypothetical protein
MATQRWTVDAGPRVYQLACFLGFTSKGVLLDLQEFFGYQGLTPSSRVPLPMAFEVASWYGHDCHYKK